jgi:hypothetical protein
MRLQTRRTVHIDKNELKQWRKAFEMYGVQSDCSRKIGFHRVTIGNIMRRGTGDETIVNKIREYFENELKPAPK